MSAEEKHDVNEIAHYDDSPGGSHHDDKDAGFKHDGDDDSLERALREDHVRAINMNTSAK